MAGARNRKGDGVFALIANPKTLSYQAIVENSPLVPLFRASEPEKMTMAYEMPTICSDARHVA